MPDANALPSLVGFYQRLLQQRKLRDSERLFTIEGPRSFLAAVENGFQFHSVIRSRVLLRNSQTARQLSRLKQEGTRITNVSPECFRIICKMPRASGIAAIVKRKLFEIGSTPVRSGLFIAVTRISSPGNLGTLLRSAAAVGCDGVLTLGDRVDPFNPQVVRASMGAFFGIPIIQTCWREFAEWKGRDGIEVVAGDPQAERTYFEHQWRKPTVLMLGDERARLSSRQQQHADTSVRIPMSANTDSLNLGVAASILMFEFARVIRFAPNARRPF